MKLINFTLNKVTINQRSTKFGAQEYFLQKTIYFEMVIQKMIYIINFIKNINNYNDNKVF